MRLFFIIFFLLAKFSEACHAQTSAIHIFVFKEDNPLQDATVKFNKKHFKTNLSGEVLVPINHKSDSITISYLGLQTQKILLNASIQDTLFVHMLSDNILIDEVKVLPPNYAKKLLAIAYKKHTQFKNWESYILQYMGEDFDYVKVTEASAHIYTPEIYKDEKKINTTIYD